MAPSLDPGSVDRLLRLLVDRVVDYAIFVLDVDGHVASWNAGAERLEGYTAEEIIGQHVAVFHPEADVLAGKPEQGLAIAVAEGHYEEEGWRLRKDGTRFWGDVVITALRTEDGRLVGFAEVTRDLTERKRGEDLLRASEERLRLLVGSVVDYAIFLVDPDGTVASWNLGAERLKGYRADEIVGRHFDRFYTEEDRRAGLPARALRQAMLHGRFESEGWRLRKDGSRFWANAVITSLAAADGTHRGFAKVTRDLTHRKRTEDALRGVLERERMTAERLRQLDQMKNELVAIVAHDLRGPIGVLQGFIELLVADWDSIADQEKLDIVGRMAGRLEGLSALAESVLDAARIEAGQLAVERRDIDVAALVSSVVADAVTTAPDRAIGVDADDSLPLACGDAQRTWQILHNLVANAIKYSPSGSPIDVRLEVDGSELIVSISDAGPGIAEEHREALFDRYTRLPASAGVAGTGMGLYIARGLVEAQGGHIWVEGKPGGGSTFCFTVPLSTRVTA